MRRITQLELTFCLLFTFIFLFGCSPGIPKGSEQDAGEVTICNLSEELIGWRVTTSGKITFIDLSPPDGVYFELEDNGCEAGGFAHNQFWNKFSEEQQKQIALYNSITVEGILTKDGGRLIVSTQKILGTP